MCGVCNLELAEANFDDHRYTQHMGLARPYGMSQEFSESEKRRELKRSIQILKEVCFFPFKLIIFTNVTVFNYFIAKFIYYRSIALIASERFSLLWASSTINRAA